MLHISLQVKSKTTSNINGHPPTHTDLPCSGPWLGPDIGATGGPNSWSQSTLSRSLGIQEWFSSASPLTIVNVNHLHTYTTKCYSDVLTRIHSRALLRTSRIHVKTGGAIRKSHEEFHRCQSSFRNGLKPCMATGHLTE